LLGALADEHEFVVFATQFDNPRPDRIRFVRVPVPTRPLALLFIAYHFVAPLCFLYERLRSGRRFDLVQSVECNCPLRSDVIYAHFCHTAFVREHLSNVGRGLRGFLRALDHRLHALIEGWAFRRASLLVCPSRGLAEEIRRLFPEVSSKLRVLANPIDVARLQRPHSFDRAGFRAALGVTESDTLLVFTALGHFERKGLPLVLQAMTQISRDDLKLNVVGGERELVEAYRNEARKLGLAGRVILSGKTDDVRPHLWSADALIFPSSYETFSLSTFEAAAAGLPLLVTQLHGVEQLLRDGHNGFLLERSVDGVRRGIERLLELTASQRATLGEQAQQDVRDYDVDNFVRRWRATYGEPGNATVATAAAVADRRV
jgi:glycosyltransferase involved in cell wall biosynthesis